MAKKSNNLLWVILIVLVASLLAYNFFGKGGRKRNFKAALVTIDTAQVNRIALTTIDGQTELVKTNGQWQVTLPNGRQVTALAGSVEYSLGQLLTIKPSRVAAKGNAKWADYKVDTTGTRVQVYEGSDNTLDIILGNLNMMGGNKMTTYVRLYDDEITFMADNFMVMSFKTKANDYRNTRMVQFNRDSISAVDAVTNGTAYSLQRTLDGQWLLNGTGVDSAAAVRYVGNYRFLDGATFVDEVDPATLPAQATTVTITANGASPVTLTYHAEPANGLVVQSSALPDALFADTDSTLYNKTVAGLAGLLN